MTPPLKPGDRVHHTGIPISRGTLVETYTARVPGHSGRAIDVAVVRWDGTPGTYTHHLSKITPLEEKETA